MIDGRHCTQKDLELLIKETNKIFEFLNKNSENEEKNEELRCFLLFLRRFDEQIADTLQTEIIGFMNNNEKIKAAIEKHVNELKQNVIIDIFEHQ